MNGTRDKGDLDHVDTGQFGVCCRRLGAEGGNESQDSVYSGGDRSAN